MFATVHTKLIKLSELIWDKTSLTERPQIGYFGCCLCLFSMSLLVKSVGGLMLLL